MNTPREHDEKIEELAGSLSRALHDAPTEDRDALRDYASEIVRSSRDEQPERRARRVAGKRGAGVAAGLLLLAFGLSFMLLVPTVGGTIAIIGLAAMAVGIVGAFVSERRRGVDARRENEISPSRVSSS